MCVGHPKRHPCQHTSVTYNHCVAARFDRATGLTTPCHNTTYAAPVDTDARCTNQLCFFEELGGRWSCCACGGGPNAVGWCVFSRPRTEVNAITGQAEQLTACDHCCCWNCRAYRESGTSALSPPPPAIPSLQGAPCFSPPTPSAQAVLGECGRRGLKIRDWEGWRGGASWLQRRPCELTWILS